MANYQWTDISNQAKGFVQGVPLSSGSTDISIIAADRVNSIMWLAAPWKWSITPMNTINCSDGVQEYSFLLNNSGTAHIMRSAQLTCVNPATQITLVTSVGGLYRVVTAGTNNGFVTGDNLRVTGINGMVTANGYWSITVINSNTFDLVGSTPAGAYVAGSGWCTKSNVLTSELNIVEYLSIEMMLQGGVNTIRDVAYVPETGRLRLGRSASVPSGTALTIDGTFQYQPTKITALATATLFPDQYVEVAIEGYLWQLYKFMQDSRAGTVQIDRDGHKQYTGQLGVFMDALESMKRAEDLGTGEAMMFPDDPLGYGRAGSGYGLFPNF